MMEWPHIPRGGAHYRAKLGENEARMIIRLHSEGLSTRALARKFEVSQTCIAHLVSARSWQHIRQTEELVKYGRYSKKNPLDQRFVGDEEAIRDYLNGKSLMEVSEDIDRSTERVRSLFKQYHILPRSQLHVSKVVAEFGEGARNYVETHTVEHLMERYSVTRHTIISSWEKQLDVKAMRTCRNCGGEFRHDEMWVLADGSVRDNLCSSEECKTAKRRSKNTESNQLDEDFIGLKAVLAMTSKRISRAKSTKGPLRHQYQGRTAIEMEQAA